MHAIARTWLAFCGLTFPNNIYIYMHALYASYAGNWMIRFLLLLSTHPLAIINILLWKYLRTFYDVNRIVLLDYYSDLRLQTSHTLWNNVFTPERWTQSVSICVFAVVSDWSIHQYLADLVYWNYSNLIQRCGYEDYGFTYMVWIH